MGRWDSRKAYTPVYDSEIPLSHRPTVPFLRKGIETKGFVVGRWWDGLGRSMASRMLRVSKNADPNLRGSRREIRQAMRLH